MYAINDPELKARMEAAANKLPIIRDEIVLLRALIEREVASATTDAEKSRLLKNVGDAIGQLAKLEKTQLELSLAANETLSKEAAHKLADTMGRLFLEEIRNLLPNPDAAVDRLQAKLAAAVRDAKNAA
jgi:hypothetical protein